jgi:uncharacterized membrane protein HdeD (DUF308 family)
VAATLLAYLMAMVLAISGALKLKSSNRLGLGIAPGSVLELVMALMLAAAPLMAWRVPTWFFACAIALVIGSSTHHAFLLGAARRRRKASEAKRLEFHVLHQMPGGLGDREE